MTILFYETESESRKMIHVYSLFLFTFFTTSINSINIDIKVCKRRDIFNEINLTNTCRLELNVHTNFYDWNLSKEQVLHQLFPLDMETRNYVRQVKNCLFSKVKPMPLKSNVKVAAVSESAMKDLLDLDPIVALSEEFLAFVNGEKVLAQPLAHRYGGHQFGSWAGQLGDGRAVLLGEYVNQKGERFELQLKGSGLTPYSRRGDGRAVIRSSVREFLCSEAMYHLGIPTSRAAAIIVSEDKVVRDMFYDGHPRYERGAIVLRLAKSWFRIGSLEILTDAGEIELLKNVTDFVISNNFKSVDMNDPNYILDFFSRVVDETAEMIVKWQGVGFTHGVCNTDNFSLLSITIDYGPFGFIDEFNPEFVPNTSDDEGRYSYERQPDVGYFNLNKLRIALNPLLSNQQQKQAIRVLNGYSDIYKLKFMNLFLAKLGLTFDSNEREHDEQLIAILLKMMEETRSDFTMTFRQLSEVNLEQLDDFSIIKSHWALQTLSKHKWYLDWVTMYQKRASSEAHSSNDRQKRMCNVNPRYILRNWIAQSVIEKVEKDNFSELQSVLKILERPFEYQDMAESLGYSSPPPYWSKKLKVSCSS